MNPVSIRIYGDSLMKATVPDENNHYHFCIDSYLQRFDQLPVHIHNCARFGATVEKGSAILDRDLQRGVDCDYALLEFGGNDCNFNWSEIAAEPEKEHLPKTELPHFIDTLSSMADKLISRGIRPILMTLPPIDAKRYLDFLTRDGISRANILKWLGDTDMIYRFHELYSHAISSLAVKKDLLCIDIRSLILPDHNFHNMISSDGIHPSKPGYDFIFQRLYDILFAHLYAAPQNA